MRSSSKYGFTPDIRSESGRQMVMSERLSHYRRLMSIRPTIDTSVPHQHVTKRRPKKATTHNDKGIQMREVKSMVDCGAPKTFQMGRKLCSTRRKKEKEMLQQHEDRVRMMFRRIQELDSPTQRKKNPLDISQHPSLIMRRTLAEAPAPMLLDLSDVRSTTGSLHSTAQSERFRRRSVRDKGTVEEKRVKEDGDMPNAGRSTIGSRPGAKEKEEEAIGEVVEETLYSRPSSTRGSSRGGVGDGGVKKRSQSSNEWKPGKSASKKEKRPQDEGEKRMNPYSRFREEVLQGVVEKRLYRAEDLVRHFNESVARADPSLDRSVLREIIAELESDFELL
eukprot:TRINITY_DN917_c0_g1_i1.p1 TRINITY_DN917_c0_g1~~TRINITY_DN917_c0_g1_i1.p1  ORF type:complete len:335 (-),score=95.98 TRINITY_DN917_c0_g1_i1:143-1147(-)